MGYFTRSAFERKAKIERAVRSHPDHEYITATLSRTRQGIHLRWNHDQTVTLPTAPLAQPTFASLSSSTSVSSVSTASAEDVRSLPSPSLTTPVGADHAGKSRFRTPSQTGGCVEDNGPRTPSKRPRPLQRHPTAKDEHVLWNSNISGIRPPPVFRRHDMHEDDEKNLAIARVQIARMEELKRKRDQAWEEALALGAFDEDDDDEELNEEKGGTSGYDASQSLASEADTLGGGPLRRQDTLRCNSVEPPSKLRPTLPFPVLPYFRVPNGTDSAPETSRFDTSIGSTPSRSCPPSTNGVVRRYWENGAWKTKGAFANIPALAHLAALDVDPSRASSEDCDEVDTNIEGWKAGVKDCFESSDHGNNRNVAKPRSLSRESTVTDIDSCEATAYGWVRTLDAM